MALIDLWKSSADQLLGKHVQQIIAFAGDGKLTDGGKASQEFRAFLAEIPSEVLTRFVEECLESFPDSGFALQDLANEIGRRLGFSVSHGRYRGTSNSIGFDGIWSSPDGHKLIIEVKTTDAYRISLNTIAAYREKLVESVAIDDDRSSILIVVGRQDTGDLEAQIRGSRHAWDVRLISCEALVRLLGVKEEVEDPKVQTRIHSVLRPREFTRLDEIVDMLFSTAADIKNDEVAPAEVVGEQTTNDDAAPRQRAAFREQCIDRIQKHLSTPLLKQSRVSFASPADDIHVVCAISRQHSKYSSPTFWFAFHDHQREFLESAAKSFIAFGCGSELQLVLIPFAVFRPLIKDLHETNDEERSYKHINIIKTGDKYELVRKGGLGRVNVSEYVLKPTQL